MNIQEHISKIKALGRILDKRHTYTILIIIFVGISSFFLGKIFSIEANRKPIAIERGDWKTVKTIQTTIPTENSRELYVGSKSGTKYHLPSCPGAKKISQANKIWFSSKIEAEKAGYSPAGNCKGLL